MLADRDDAGHQLREMLARYCHIFGQHCQPKLLECRPDPPANLDEHVTFGGVLDVSDKSRAVLTANVRDGFYGRGTVVSRGLDQEQAGSLDVEFHPIHGFHLTK